MSLRTAGDRNKFAQQLFADLPARYDRLAEWLWFGQNGRWRTAMVDRIVPASPNACWTSRRGLQASPSAGRPYERTHRWGRPDAEHAQDRPAQHRPSPSEHRAPCSS